VEIARHRERAYVRMLVEIAERIERRHIVTGTRCRFGRRASRDADDEDSSMLSR
jgi:hypothetical protein